MDWFIPYAAGLFDGEGWITLERRAQTAPTRSVRPKYTLVAAINMCDEAPLHLLHERWGGYLYRRAPQKVNWRPCLRWILQSAKTEPFLRDILPYLYVKHQHAQLALEFQESVRTWNHRREYGGGLPDAAYEERERFYESFHLLNTNGLKLPV